MSSYNRFSYLSSGFGALQYRSLQRTNTTRSYIVQYMATHIHAKVFVGSWGEGRYSIKHFHNYYIFHTKIDCFSPKFRSCGTKTWKQILLSNSALFREVNLCIRRQMDSFLVFQKPYAFVNRNGQRFLQLPNLI